MVLDGDRGSMMLERPYHEHTIAFEASVAEKIAIIERALVRNTRGISRIVDVGTGPGGVAQHLAREHPEAEVIGIDRDIEMIRIARMRHVAPNLSYHCSSACDELPDEA